MPLEAQTVVCPVCRNINSYGRPATSQYINYANGPPGNMNANNRYHQGSFPSPPQRQPPLHASPQGPQQLSPRGVIGHGYYQPPPPPPPPNNVYYDQPLPLESLRPVRTKSYYQQPPQTSSPHGSPHPVHGNSYYQQAPQTSSPHGSPRPAHSNSNYYQQPPQTLSPQGSPRPTYTNDYYQPEVTPPQRSPRPLRTNSVFRPPMQTSPPQGSPRPPHSNGYYQQLFQASSPHLSLRPMDSGDYCQQPQTSPRPTHNSGYYEQDSPPSEYIHDYYQQLSQAPSHVSSSSPRPSPHVSPPRMQSNGYYQQPLQTSPQVSTAQVQPPPHGSSPWVYTNGYHQQPSQTLPHVPSPHVSPPRVDSNGYYQQPFRTPPQASLQSAVQEVSPPQARANSYHQQASQQSPRISSPHVQISPQVSNPPKYGRKRAVICGVSYRGQKSSLDGSINDAISMKDFLVRSMRFPDSSIILLTEDETDPSRIPTKGNMQMALSWLVEGCQPGDSLVFYYSGHGSRERDFDGDEIDGFDEVLCPVDYKTAGKITDDEINALIVRPLRQGAKLHAIIDTCFSGSIIDLPFMCRMNRKGETTWEDQRIQYAEYKGASGGIAVSISACDDHQKSGDTTAFTGNSAGALTYSFIQTLTNEPKLTYGRLLKSMRNKITEAQERLGQPPQEPQLSSSEKFDIHSKPIIL